MCVYVCIYITNDQVLSIQAADGSQTSSVFLSGLDQGTTPKQVLDFLKTYGLDKGCNCTKMITKKDHLYSSFKLIVPDSRKQEIMAAELWPKGTVISHFQNLQRRSQIKV